MSEKRIILIEDRSTSMSNVPQYPSLREKVFAELAELFPAAVIWVYAMWQQIQLLQPRVSFGGIEPIQPGSWKHATHGGVLHGGTAICSALCEAYTMVWDWKQCGFDGEVGVFVLTDGQCRLDSRTHSDAHHAMNELRRYGATVKLFGFLHHSAKFDFGAFITAVGLKPNEVEVEWWSGVHLAEAADTSMTTLSETLSGFLGKNQS